jgi:hypothetical protein
MDKLKELANFISTHCNQDDKLNSDFIQALYSYKYSSYLSTPSTEVVKDYIRIIERPNDLFLTDRENEDENEEYYDDEEEDEIIENEDLNPRVEETTINIGGTSYHYYNPSGQLGAGLEDEEPVLRRLTEQNLVNELERIIEARRNQAQNASSEVTPDLSPPIDVPF